VTITAGANDFLRGDVDIASIARRVAESVNLLLNNGSVFVASPVLDPVTFTPCRALGGVTILVSNYYSIPHPIPIVAAQLDAALQGFDQALRFWLQFVHVPAGPESPSSTFIRRPWVGKVLSRSSGGWDSRARSISMSTRRTSVMPSSRSSSRARGMA
jgi:hypothetical protein